MKYLVALLLLNSTFAFADLEHRQGQGLEPVPEKLSVARGCFKEIESFGCGHPRDGQEIFTACLHDKKELLSSECQTFFQRLYGKRK